MRGFLRSTAYAAAITACAGLTACADQTPEQAPTSSAPPTTAQATTARLAAADCAATPPAGPVGRSGYELNYATGTMKVAVTQAGRPARCVAFTKSGRADPTVPTDTLLFTFSGTHGEGAQLEFLAVDLAGGVLPWPVGASARAPGAPITATVGVSLDGEYFTSSSCTLTLTSVDKSAAGGRFDCPAALAQPANPMDPDDDVSYDEPSEPATPPTPAMLSGLFEVAA